MLNTVCPVLFSEKKNCFVYLGKLNVVSNWPDVLHFSLLSSVSSLTSSYILHNYLAFRSCCLHELCEKAPPKVFVTFVGNQRWRSKLAWNFTKLWLHHWYFPVIFLAVSRTADLQNTSRRLHLSFEQNVCHDPLKELTCRNN